MPKLVFHDSDGIDRTIDLGSEIVMIGRATECQVQTQDAMVSRRHARITWDGGYWIEDLGSSNGVIISGTRLERGQRAPLRPGDEVRCGSLVLKLVPDLGRGNVIRNTPPIDPMAANPARRVMTGGFAPQSAPPMDYGAPPPMDYGAPPMPNEFDSMAEMPAPVVPPREPSPPPAAPSGRGAGTMLAEFNVEKQRRLQAEAAVLTAEQRAATAEGKLYEYEQQISELQSRVNSAETQAQTAKTRANEMETAAREGDRWRRQVDQLKADIRRLRGGAPVEETEVKEVGGAELASVAAERDRLKQRVTDLEAEVSRLEASGRAAPVGPVDVQVPSSEAAQLKRKVDQLNAELRRVRGGGAPDDGSARIAELEAKLARAEQERDEARGRADNTATQPAAPAADGAEVAKLKRLLEQLTAENRRLRGGGAPPTEDPRVAELQAKLEEAKAERERDAAKPKAAAVDPGAAGAADAINDALSDLRGSLRAAKDEIGVLGVEAPGDSVTVLKDAIGSANDQLETARNALKDLRKVLKLPA